MPGKTIHEIALTMSADMSQGMREIDNLEKKIRELTRVQRILDAQGQDTSAIQKEIAALRQKQLEVSKLKGLTQDLSAVQMTTQQGINQATKGNAKVAQSFNQLSFAAEDFFSVVDTMGVRGGLRAAGNNLSMVARILGGPLMGGLVGVGLVALPMLIKAFGEAENKSNDFVRSLNKQLDALQKVSSIRIDDFNFSTHLRDFTKKMSLEDVTEALRSNRDELKRIEITIDEAQKNREFLTGRLREDISQATNKFVSVAGTAMTEQKLALVQIAKVIGPERAELFKKEIDHLTQQMVLSIADRPQDTHRIVNDQIRELQEINTRINEALNLAMRSGDTDLASYLHARLEADPVAQHVKFLEELREDEQALNELRDSSLKISESLTEGEKERLRNAREFNILEEKRIQLLQEQKREAFEALRVEGMSPAEKAAHELKQQLLELKEVTEAAGGRLGGPLHMRARDKIIREFLEANKKELPPSVMAGGQGAGPNTAEQVAGAVNAAQKQLFEAAQQKDERDPQMDELIDAVKGWFDKGIPLLQVL